MFSVILPTPPAPQLRLSRLQDAAGLALIGSLLLASRSFAASPKFTVDATHPSAKVSPMLYGLMTEEINHSYDGGLYAELIRNRAFLDQTNQPVYWSLLTEGDAQASIALDTARPCNDALTSSLRFSAVKASKTSPAAVANSGYWGIPIQPHAAYHLTLLARAAPGSPGALAVALVGDENHTSYASQTISGLRPDWRKFQTVLKTGGCKPAAKARFVISASQPGTYWFALASLMPPTWNNRPNGLRRDLMQMLIDLHPKFLRFPGGNYLEGDTPDTRFDWKKTLGPIEERPGHPCPWGYRSSDGLGLLEFLEWCEDMTAEPLLAVYAGYSLKGAHILPGPGLEPFVQDALDEIEYVIGDTTTAWGARRARDGHPAPFKLTCVEIGNEDWFDRSRTYDGRFAQFHKAIKARYPFLKTISSIGNEQPADLHVHTVQPDLLDEHYYRSTDEFLRMSPDYARAYERRGPELFVGEWAAHEDASIKPWSAAARQQPPTPSMKAALGDAAFMAAMERNSDIIKMQCYAPLLVNVNPGGRQWRPNLIGYDALSSFGSPSYYAFQMFSRNVGDEILPVVATDTAVQGCATRDSRTGGLFVKLVNPDTNALSLHLEIKGIASLQAHATALTLTGNPEDINSITEPRKVVPLLSKFTAAHPAFTWKMPPSSVVLLTLRTRP